MQRLSLLIVALASAGLPVACSSTEDPRMSVRATQGVVVQAGLEDVWRAVQVALPGAHSAGEPMSAATTVRGVAVEARVERYNDAKTILHVTSPDPSVAEDVQLSIQRALLNR